MTALPRPGFARVVCSGSGAAQVLPGPGLQGRSRALSEERWGAGETVIWRRWWQAGGEGVLHHHHRKVSPLLGRYSPLPPLHKGRRVCLPRHALGPGCSPTLALLPPHIIKVIIKAGRQRNRRSVME